MIWSLLGNVRNKSYFVGMAKRWRLLMTKEHSFSKLHQVSSLKKLLIIKNSLRCPLPMWHKTQWTSSLVSLKWSIFNLTVLNQSEKPNKGNVRDKVTVTCLSCCNCCHDRGKWHMRPVRFYSFDYSILLQSNPLITRLKNCRKFVRYTRVSLYPNNKFTWKIYRRANKIFKKCSLEPGSRYIRARYKRVRLYHEFKFKKKQKLLIFLKKKNKIKTCYYENHRLRKLYDIIRFYSNIFIIKSFINE